jgi:hypothetical protein
VVPLQLKSLKHVCRTAVFLKHTQAVVAAAPQGQPPGPTRRSRALSASSGCTLPAQTLAGSAG